MEGDLDLLHVDFAVHHAIEKRSDQRRCVVFEQRDQYRGESSCAAAATVSVAGLILRAARGPDVRS